MFLTIYIACNLQFNRKKRENECERILKNKKKSIVYDFYEIQGIKFLKTTTKKNNNNKTYKRILDFQLIRTKKKKKRKTIFMIRIYIFYLKIKKKIVSLLFYKLILFFTVLWITCILLLVGYCFLIFLFKLK